jgi:hypothetical protein
VTIKEVLDLAIDCETRKRQETVASQLEALRCAAADGGYELPAEFFFIDDG